MDFWSWHNVLFIAGLIFLPRMMLIYFGLISPMSISPILGMLFVPRMFLSGILTSVYWDTNPILVSICWIVSIIIDLAGTGMKFKMQAEIFQLFMRAIKLNLEGVWVIIKLARCL